MASFKCSALRAASACFAIRSKLVDAFEGVTDNRISRKEMPDGIEKIYMG